MTSISLTQNSRIGRPVKYDTPEAKKRAHAKANVRMYYKKKGITKEKALELKAKRKTDKQQALTKRKAIQDRLKKLYKKSRSLDNSQIEAIITHIQDLTDSESESD